MVTRRKTLTLAAFAAGTLGAAVASTATPVQASPRYDGYYYYGPNLGYAAGNVAGNVIAAGSYPYYESYSGRPHGTTAYGAPYAYPYPGYGFYYGY